MFKIKKPSFNFFTTFIISIVAFFIYYQLKKESKNERILKERGKLTEVNQMKVVTVSGRSRTIKYDFYVNSKLYVGQCKETIYNIPLLKSFLVIYDPINPENNDLLLFKYKLILYNKEYLKDSIYFDGKEIDY